MTIITDVSKPMYLKSFVWGLKLEIKREVLIFPLVSLTDANEKAQLCEERIHNLTGKVRKERNKSFSEGVTLNKLTVGSAPMGSMRTTTFPLNRPLGINQNSVP